MGCVAQAAGLLIMQPGPAAELFLNLALTQS